MPSRWLSGTATFTAENALVLSVMEIMRVVSAYGFLLRQRGTARYNSDGEA